MLSIVELKSLLSRALGHNCVGYCDVGQAPNRDDVLCYLMMDDLVVVVNRVDMTENERHNEDLSSQQTSPGHSQFAHHSSGGERPSEQSKDIHRLRFTSLVGFPPCPNDSFCTVTMRTIFVDCSMHEHLDIQSRPYCKDGNSASGNTC